MWSLPASLTYLHLCSPFGGHVLEVLLEQVSKAMEASEVASELAEEVRTLLHAQHADPA